MSVGFPCAMGCVYTRVLGCLGHAGAVGVNGVMTGHLCRQNEMESCSESIDFSCAFSVRNGLRTRGLLGAWHTHRSNDQGFVLVCVTQQEGEDRGYQCETALSQGVFP